MGNREQTTVMEDPGEPQGQPGPDTKGNLLVKCGGRATGAVMATAITALACLALGIVDSDTLPGNNFATLTVLTAALVCLSLPCGRPDNGETKALRSFLTHTMWGAIISTTALAFGLTMVNHL